MSRNLQGVKHHQCYDDYEWPVLHRMHHCSTRKVERRSALTLKARRRSNDAGCRGQRTRCMVAKLRRAEHRSRLVGHSTIPAVLPHRQHRDTSRSSIRRLTTPRASEQSSLDEAEQHEPENGSGDEKSVVSLHPWNPDGEEAHNHRQSPDVVLGLKPHRYPNTFFATLIACFSAADLLIASWYSLAGSES